MTESLRRFTVRIGERPVVWLRAAFVGLMVACFAIFVWRSLHWTIIWDGSDMHYVHFLLAHGFRPYSDITDMNLPGTYLTEGWGMALVGGSDLGWRIYDYLLMLVMAAAMLIIAKPYGRLGGFYAAGIFIALYGSEGPRSSIERDLVVAVWLVIAYAAFFLALRQQRPWLMGLAGVAGAIAASVKPQYALVSVGVMTAAVIVLRRRKIPLGPFVGWWLSGFALIVAVNLGFLFVHHAFRDFLFVERVATGSYVASGRLPMHELVRRVRTKASLQLLMAALILMLAARRRGQHWSWERWALLGGAGYGLFSFFLQGKGYSYHFDIFLAFMLLLLGLEFATGLREQGARRILAAMALVVSLLPLPHLLLRLARAIPGSYFTTALENDLNTLGGTAALQNKVQCFDIVDGCLSALYHLGIVNNNGFTGDLLLFADGRGPAIQYYRDRYWQLDHANPGEVIVLSNQWYARPADFHKLDNWPEFRDFLAENYTEVNERQFPLENFAAGQKPDDPSEAGTAAYRIYIRNGSPLMARAAALR